MEICSECGHKNKNGECVTGLNCSCDCFSVAYVIALKNLNAEMLEALKMAENELAESGIECIAKKLRVVIKKAEGK